MTKHLWPTLSWIIFCCLCFSTLLICMSQKFLWIKKFYGFPTYHRNYSNGLKFTKETITSIDKWWKLDTLSAKPNCSQLVNKMVFNITEKDFDWYPDIPNDDVFVTMSCNELDEYWLFPKHPKSYEEDNFPLAFVFFGQKNIFQTLSLFRSIYWPQNVYCLNWDAKSSDSYQKILRRLSTCFTNVISPIQRSIFWGDYSLLQATMDCLHILDQFKARKWKYLQIVSWNDYPLKTNEEMVKIFKVFNGANDVSLGSANMDFILGYSSKKSKRMFGKVPMPPSSLILYKGSFAVALSRNFIEFVTHDPKAQGFYRWLNGTWCAEEHFWSTLNHNLHLNPPGGYPGACLQFHSQRKSRKPFITRYQLWPHTTGVQCKGKIVHKSCVFGIRDLSDIVHAKQLWAHKVYQEFQPATLYCLQKWFFEKVDNPSNSLDSKAFNDYANLAQVRYNNLKRKNSYVC